MNSPINICIVHFNTPLLTECLVKSINKFTPNSKIYIFDNSDKLPFTYKQNNIIYIDNTNNQIINFEQWLEKYPNRNKSTEKTNSFGSAKHCYTIQKCIELIDDNFILLDSDILLKKDISDIIDNTCAYSGEIVLQPLTKSIHRILPFICYINVKMLKANNAKYFNDNFMHGLYKSKQSDMYDTGGGFYEETKNLKHKDIKVEDYIVHYKGGSWYNDNVKAFGKKILPFRWVLYHYDLWNNCEISYKCYLDSLQSFLYEKQCNYDIINPKTLPEKINWLKIFDTTSLKTLCADKIKVHQYCKKKLGKDICIPILKEYKSVDDIDFNKLPKSFVLKCNHGSGMNIIVTDKSKLDIDKVKEKLNNWLNCDFSFRNGYEMQYHKIDRKIFAETYMNDGHSDLTDYKFLCFNGEPKLCQVINDRNNSNRHLNYYDMNFKFVNISRLDFPNNPTLIDKRPKCFKQMKEYAKKLAQEFKFVRVDFYEINGKIYLGELTFTPGAGRIAYKNPNDGIYLGNMLDLHINLPKNKKVIYTCITKNYDVLNENQYYLSDYDYVCFTDNPNLKSELWDIRQIPNGLKILSPVKQARYIKTHPHVFFKKYNLSVWIDATITIKSDFSELIDNNILQVPMHPDRNCLYSEARMCIKLKKDIKENINPQVEEYKKEGYPENNGLAQTNILIRKHNNKNCIKLMDDWWKEIKTKSCRDQISFNYVLWKNKDIEISYLDKKIFNSKYFFWNTKHEKVKKDKIEISPTQPLISYTSHIETKQTKTNTIIKIINKPTVVKTLETYKLPTKSINRRY